MVTANVVLKARKERHREFANTHASSRPPISNNSRTWPITLQSAKRAAPRSASSVATSRTRNAALVRYSSPPKSTRMAFSPPEIRLLRHTMTSLALVLVYPPFERHDAYHSTVELLVAQRRI